ERLDDVAVFEQILWPAAVVGNGGRRVDTQHVIKRGQHVLRAIRTGDRIFAEFVSGADVLPHLQPAAGEEYGASARPVIAAAEVVELWRAPKLAPGHDADIVGQ